MIRGAWAAFLLLPVGCHGDKRISVDELHAIEQETVTTTIEVVKEQELALTDFRPYQVRPGDVLAITMFGLAEDRYSPTVLELRVHDDGQVVLPVVGPIRVAGLDLGAIEQAIIAAHVPAVTKDLSVYVQLAGPEATTVLVQGAANVPGLVKLNQNQRNLLYALASASGFGPTSSGRVRLRPIRSDQPEVVYDLNNINDVRRALLAPPLDSGDVIVVEAADNNAIYVGGLVNRPGPILIPPQSTLSVLRAVTAAGGLREYLRVKDATLVRALPNGEQVHVKLNFDDMLAGRAPDLALRPGDILNIPQTASTLTQEWFLRNMLLGPFNVGLRYDPLAQYNANRVLKTQADGGDGLLQGIRTTLGTSLPEAFVPPVPQP